MAKAQPQTPIRGPAKAGSGKAAIMAAGGGRKALRTFRSLPEASRKALKANPGILGQLTSIRETRAASGRGRISGTTPAQSKLLKKGARN
jgi:hypothetical protein